MYIGFATNTFQRGFAQIIPTCHFKSNPFNALPCGPADFFHPFRRMAWSGSRPSTTASSWTDGSRNRMARAEFGEEKSWRQLLNSTATAFFPWQLYRHFSTFFKLLQYLGMVYTIYLWYQCWFRGWFIIVLPNIIAFFWHGAHDRSCCLPYRRLAMLALGARHIWRSTSFFVCKVVSVSILVALFLGTKCGFTTKHMFSDHVLGNLDCCQVNRQMFLNHVQPFGEAHMNVNCLADCGSCNLVCKEFKIIITTTSTIYLYVFHEVNVLGWTHGDGKKRPKSNLGVLHVDITVDNPFTSAAPPAPADMISTGQELEVPWMWSPVGFTRNPGPWTNKQRDTKLVDWLVVWSILNIFPIWE